ncbi:MAG: hypothetical protein ACLQVY_15715 [Limisphaerales bacterium]
MAFESLTDNRIRELLEMPKRVANPTARNIADANHDRRDYVVESADGAERFKLFARQNKTDCNIGGLETKADHPELFQ